MKHAHDDIIVGKITLRYSEKHRGWLTPAKLIIRNPAVAERVAETLNDSIGDRKIEAGKNED